MHAAARVRSETNTHLRAHRAAPPAPFWVCSLSEPEAAERIGARPTLLRPPRVGRFQRLLFLCRHSSDLRDLRDFLSRGRIRAILTRSWAGLMTTYATCRSAGIDEPRCDFHPCEFPRLWCIDCTAPSPLAAPLDGSRAVAPARCVLRPVDPDKNNTPRPACARLLPLSSACAQVQPPHVPYL